MSMSETMLEGVPDEHLGLSELRGNPPTDAEVQNNFTAEGLDALDILYLENPGYYDRLAADQVGCKLERGGYDCEDKIYDTSIKG